MSAPTHFHRCEGEGNGRSHAGFLAVVHHGHALVAGGYNEGGHSSRVAPKQGHRGAIRAVHVVVGGVAHYLLGARATGILAAVERIEVGCGSASKHATQSIVEAKPERVVEAGGEVGVAVALGQQQQLVGFHVAQGVEGLLPEINGRRVGIVETEAVDVGRVYP